MKLETISLLFILQIFIKPSNSDTLNRGLEALKTSSTPPKDFSKIVEDIKKNYKNNPSDPSLCQTCVKVFDQVLTHRRSGSNRESMISFFSKLCGTFTDWAPVACEGFIDIQIDTALYIIDNRRELTAQRVCAITFQYLNCTDPNRKKWSIDLPGGKLENFVERKGQKKEESLKILHLTDFHIDPQYKPGSNSDCGLPLCCEESNGPSGNDSTSAGFWGDYHVCDMPWHTVTNFTDYVINYHKKFDIVYYTGDIISHKSWATTKDYNIKSIKDIFQLFKKTFGSTPLYPILGNHEPHPADSYSPLNITGPSVSTQWIFDLASEEWSRWLPLSTKATISKGGFYTVLVQPGFRIVALNSNVCFVSNLWLIYDDKDPYGQLKWLVEVLTAAESNNEKVHILSHIPPGELRCLEEWTLQFRRIVNRFSRIISAQFNGHTHLDELRLFYDLDNKKVVNVAFNGGSFTTFVGLNPNYRVYSVNPQSLQVLDYDHYTFNLTKANLDKTQSPEWYKLYSLKEAYKMNDTNLEDFQDLIDRMRGDKNLVRDYFRFQVRESGPEMAQGCDDKCLAKLYCSITAVQASKALECGEI